jgi:hypothetical protein
MEIEFSEWHWQRGGRGKGVCSRVSYVAEYQPTLSTREREEGNPDVCEVPFFAFQLPMTCGKFPLLPSRYVGIRHDGSVTIQWGGFCSQTKNRVVPFFFFVRVGEPPRRRTQVPSLVALTLFFQLGGRERGALPFLNTPLTSCVYISHPLVPPFLLSLLPFIPSPPSLIIPPPPSPRVFELRLNSPSKEPEITDLSRTETMLCQWSASHCLEDHPARSVQHEYRFPPIIQLDEVAPPPPVQKVSFSPVPSSSQSYDYWSSSEECDEEEDGEEEATESYCSSDPSCPGFGVEGAERGSASVSTPVEQKVKMSRVMAWRNSFDSAFADDNAGMFSFVPCNALGIFPTPLATRHISISDVFGSMKGSRRALTYRIVTPPRTCNCFWVAFLT